MSNLPEFEGETSPNFKKIIVEGVIGNVDSIGLELLIYSHQRIVDKALDSEPLAFNRITYKRTAECELVLSPTQLKSVYLWLGSKLEEYEALFGKIPSTQELQSRLKDHQESK
ncbi:MAG: hypothetical protein M3N27_02790, partial [Thermoproteota archaeon]|nr:hypothetical protein [Thermoproteota archaeon]